MRVLVVVPLTGLSAAVLARRQATLSALARPGTEVVFRLAALQVAELLAAGGYRFSRLSYPVPRKLGAGGAAGG